MILNLVLRYTYPQSTVSTVPVTNTSGLAIRLTPASLVHSLPSPHSRCAISHSESPSLTVYVVASIGLIGGTFRVGKKIRLGVAVRVLNGSGVDVTVILGGILDGSDVCVRSISPCAVRIAVTVKFTSGVGGLLVITATVPSPGKIHEMTAIRSPRNAHSMPQNSLGRLRRALCVIFALYIVSVAPDCPRQ